MTGGGALLLLVLTPLQIPPPSSPILPPQSSLPIPPSPILSPKVRDLGVKIAPADLVLQVIIM
jgi:hypothetical protein